MATLKINGTPVTVTEGATVLDAAMSASVEIPTLCFMKECEPETSCMLCVVKDVDSGRLLPACSAMAVDGMNIDTECEEVESARRDTLNLLLSEHVGDCEAPCTRICPAHLDIPLMLRELEQGRMESAAWIARRDLAIPVALGHVCPAPCEKGCRRGKVDESITIRDLHRYAAESVPAATKSFPANGKRAAVVGSGPAGLSCAWALRQLGYACSVLDEASKAGGSLREHEGLPQDVLDAEIAWLEQVGIVFRLGSAISMHEVADEFDGVVFAGVPSSETHFADAIYAEEHKLTVRAVGAGKAAALALHRSVQGISTEPVDPFDSKVGALRESELQELMKNSACSEGRKGIADPRTEAARCLHCDCRKPANCKLRAYSTRYGANQREFPADERKHVHVIGQGGAVVFEPGKCVKCGLCVKITKRAGEALGLAFVGRGFNTQVAVPFDEALEAGLTRTASDCVEACPTGALAFRDAEEKLG